MKLTNLKLEKVYDQISLLDRGFQLSKHERFVQGVIDAVQMHVIEKGSRLPSISDCVLHLGFARETVSKGYRELIKRGVVISIDKIGFFVANNDVSRYLKVALIIAEFDNVHELFYNTFRSQLKDEINVDLYFHQNRIEVLTSLVSRVKGMYNFYVVAPILHQMTAEILNEIPMDRFLMIDRYIKLAANYAYVVQEFKESSHQVFMELLTSIRTFEGGLVYFHKSDYIAPPGILAAVKRFGHDTGTRCEVLPEYIPGSIVRGKVYYTTSNSELWMMIKDCINKGLEVGKDVGILSHNDDIIKELICNGITTYSTDFKLMGEMAANFISTNKCIREVIPTKLRRRNSI